MAELMQPIFCKAIRVDTSGKPNLTKVNKDTIVKYGLPAHHLRLLHPLFPCPPTILGREKAIVVNLENVRCIIAADEVLLLENVQCIIEEDEVVLLGSDRSYVKQYVEDLRRRLTKAKAGGDEHSEAGRVEHSEFSDLSLRRGTSFNNIFGNTSLDHLPFEFRALEVALEAAYNILETEAETLETEARALPPELISETSAPNLKLFLEFKSKLASLTRRVQKVKDALEQLLNDKGQLAEMYLTRKKRRMESTFYESSSIPVSPVAARPEGGNPEKRISIAKSWHEGTSSSESAMKDRDIEMLLEVFLFMIESKLYTLTSLKERIEETENTINIRLDRVRNKLIKFNLLMTTASLVISIFGMVTGIFGMQFTIQFYHNAGAFKWVLMITGAIVITIFLALCWFFKYERLM